MIATTSVRHVSEQEFPGTLPLEEQLHFLVRYAVLAPSARNAQPWRFTLNGDTVLLRADPERWQRVADPDQRELYLSLGCALENLLVAAEHFGFRHSTAYFPDPSDERLAAAVTFGPGGVPSPERSGLTLQALLARRTAHGPFTDRALHVSELRALEQSARDGEVVVTFSEAPGRRHAVAALHERACEVLLGRDDYRRELAELVGQGNFGMPWPLAKVGRLALSRESIAHWLERAELASIRSTPVLALISAPGDDHRAHLRSGQVLERLWLAATARGLGLQPASAAIELPETRVELAAVFGIGERLVPQELVRIGETRGPRGFLTPRRPAGEVVGS
ncbi:MAG TPA: nitroreductase family protein [Gemmatimonadales bacterium]